MNTISINYKTIINDNKKSIVNQIYRTKVKCIKNSNMDKNCELELLDNWNCVFKKNYEFI